MSTINGAHKLNNLILSEKINVSKFIIKIKRAKKDDNQKIYLKHVNYFYRRSTDYGLAKSCQVNVNCTNGIVSQPWCNEIRSVFEIDIHLQKQSDTSKFLIGRCTASLLSQNGDIYHPYALTAGHCLTNYKDNNGVLYIPNFSRSVSVFNWQSPDCAQTVADGTDKNYVLGINYFFSRVGVSEKNFCSDIGLIELSRFPHWQYNVFYSGWDRYITPQRAAEGNGSNSTVIGHPRGDQKKITQGKMTNGEDPYSDYTAKDCTWGFKIYLGGLESGQSGSPILFNENKLVTGVYAIGNNQYDCGGQPDNIYHYFSKLEWNWNDVKSFLAPFDQSATNSNGVDPLANNFTCKNYDVVIDDQHWPAKKWQTKNLITIQASHIISTLANSYPTVINSGANYAYKAAYGGIIINSNFKTDFMTGNDPTSGFRAYIDDCIAFSGCGSNFSQKIVKLDSFDNKIIINKSEINKFFSISPNPTFGIFNLKYRNINSEIKLTITDIFGKVIFNDIKSKDFIFNNNMIQIDITDYPQSIYYLILKTESKNYSIKISKL